MQIPGCANFRDGLCERSDTVLLETRDGKSYVVFCRTCKLVHAWTRSKVKEQAREQNRLKKYYEASAREREQARRAVKFYAPPKGWVR